MNQISFAVAAHAVPAIQKDPRRGQALAWCAMDFRYFLRFWWFLDQETGTPRRLGEVLWPGQEEFIITVKEHPFVFGLKARKLGFTTLEQAWDGWVARFRGTNERVHVFSRREDAANEILRAVKYGLDRLPDWMKLPYGTSRTNELHLIAGEDDTRIVKAYPADEDTAVEATCTHGHVDEWARMGNPRRVWQAIEPSMAGTCHIITTGMGPNNYSSTYWLMTKQGDTRFHPFFVKATMRPDRDEAFVIKKRKEMPEADARREYPMTDKDSLYAGANLLFSGDKLEHVGTIGVGPQPAQEGHEYVKSWDIGRHRDAAVGVVWDITEVPYQIVAYKRLRSQTYPTIQLEIERTHAEYPGLTVIESNNAGEAVAENLELVKGKDWDLHHTTTASKPRMLKKMEVAIANYDVAWSKDAYHQLHTEFDAYQLPDTNIIQDSVMAACIGYDYVTDPKKQKRKKAKARVFTA